MDVRELYRQASEAFGAGVAAVDDDQWRQPTPCAGWDVRALVHHVVEETRWVPPLLAGRTIAEVGDDLSGDLLGDRPAAAWSDAAAAAVEAVAADGSLGTTTHLSFGDVPGEEYVRQLTADLVVHGWDLARSVGGDEALAPHLVRSVAAWFAMREDAYRGAGAIGPRRQLPDDAPEQDRLLAAFGRNPSPDDPLSVVRRFNSAFGAHDVEALAALVTDDCLFEDTTPPDGRRHEGRGAALAAWRAVFQASPAATFETEEGVLAGDRATYRWSYRWGDGHVRGIDLFLVRGGRIAEKRSYVKG